MRARRIVAAAAGLALTAVLAGCSEEPADPVHPAGPAQPDGPKDAGQFSVTEVQVGDRIVTCVVWDGYKEGGLSCDWAGARPVASGGPR